MTGRSTSLAVLTALALCAPALARDVHVATLAAPDFFSTGALDTGVASAGEAKAPPARAFALEGLLAVR